MQPGLQRFRDHLLRPGFDQLVGVAFVASAVTAFVAVKWLLRYIQSHRFTAFAVYRVLLGVALLAFIPEGG